MVMPKVEFDVMNGMALLGELARISAPSAEREEICCQAVALISRALGASGGAAFLREASDGPIQACCRHGEPDSGAADLAKRCVAAGEVLEEKGRGETPARVALPLSGEWGLAGALVLERPGCWDAAAQSFATSAARTLGSALRASGLLQEAQLQGELLARRNVELETLRELADALHEKESEEEILQTALDQVLAKLGLESGWIFWGESKRENLQLAASRGVSPEFVSRSRSEGIGECLCQDVFATGRLRFARNTTECPRMPALVGGQEMLAHACIPLKFERGTLGVMNVANRPGRLFSPQELQFLETVGNHVCLSVDKARSLRAEKRRNAESRALASLARAIGGSLEERKVLLAVGDYTRELLHADRCLIFLGESPSSLTFAHLSGPPVPGMEAGKVVDLEALGSRAFAGSIREKRALVIRNAFEDRRANNELARRWRIGSAIVVPLIAHGHLDGLLVAGRDNPSTWSEDDEELAGALAGQAAVAIESTRLYREAQEALLRLQQAQYGMMRAERLAAVGTLASGLAHEVRNPLNSINLQLVLLARRVGKLAEPMQGELTKLLEAARKEISRLDGLVEEFLSLSSIDRISINDTQPEEVVREVMDLMLPVGRDRNVLLSEETSGLIPKIPMDREKMKQVLINLVRNAIEAMPDGGQVNLTTQLSRGMVSIAVADTGTGIPPGLDVFDFFVTTKRGGTGLGLPIARRIVEAHGGSLNYESQVGRGTTFTILMRTK